MPAFNYGEIVKCIDSTEYGGRLTKNKTYKILGYINPYVEVMADDGDRINYYARRFARIATPIIVSRAAINSSVHL